MLVTLFSWNTSGFRVQNLILGNRCNMMFLSTFNHRQWDPGLRKCWKCLGTDKLCLDLIQFLSFPPFFPSNFPHFLSFSAIYWEKVPGSGSTFPEAWWDAQIKSRAIFLDGAILNVSRRQKFALSQIAFIIELELAFLYVDLQRKRKSWYKLTNRYISHCNDLSHDLVMSKLKMGL